MGLISPTRRMATRARAQLELPPAVVQRSLARLGETPVYNVRLRRINRTAAEELLTRAVPYTAPARLGAPTRHPYPPALCKG